MSPSLSTGMLIPATADLATDAAPHTVSLPVSDLHRLLTDLLGCAARPGQTYSLLEGLAGVLLHTRNHDGHPIMVGHATDRYVLAQIWEPLPVDTVTVWPQTYLTVDQARIVLAAIGPAFRPDPDEDDESAWSTEPQTAHLTRQGSSLAVALNNDRAAVRLDLVDQLYPRIEHLLDPPAATTHQIKLTPGHLRVLLDVADRRGDSLEVTVARKAIHVVIGDRVRAVVTSVPMRHAVHIPPVFVPPMETEHPAAPAAVATPSA
jgi:hypothetical protein